MVFEPDEVSLVALAQLIETIDAAFACIGRLDHQTDRSKPPMTPDQLWGDCKIPVLPPLRDEVYQKYIQAWAKDGGDHG